MRSPEVLKGQLLKVRSKSVTSKTDKCTIQQKLDAAQLAFKEHVVTENVVSEPEETTNPDSEVKGSYATGRTLGKKVFF